MGDKFQNLQLVQGVKTLVSKANNLKTIVGDEFDDDLRLKLMDVLRYIGATPIDSTRSLGGSQDLEELDVVVDGRSVRMEAETYIGLSISGPRDLNSRFVKLASELSLQIEI